MVRYSFVVPLVVHQAESRRAVAEGGAEDGHVLAVGRVDDGVVGLDAVLVEPGAHGPDELAGGIGRGRQGAGDLGDGHVADPQLVLVDEGVVDAVDAQFAQQVVVHPGRTLVVAEAQGLEEILVDDVGAGGDDGVDHVVLDHQGDGVLQAGGKQGAGQGQDHAAIGVGQHAVGDVRGRGQVAGLERHVAVGARSGAGRRRSVTSTWRTTSLQEITFLQPVSPSSAAAEIGHHLVDEPGRQEIRGLVVRVGQQFHDVEAHHLAGTADGVQQSRVIWR